MGCGKSSVGRRLSQLLCCPFIDLDDVIEKRTVRTIAEIFAAEGEAGFRKIELNILSNTLSEESARQRAPLAPSHFVGPSPYAGVRRCQFRPNASPISTVFDSSPLHNAHLILALGGGTVMTPQCAELAKEKTLCIYLKASVDTLMQRLASETESRPLLRQDISCDHQLRDRIEALLAERSATYENTAHIVIDTDAKSIETIASEIISKFN